jgi:thioredoxin-related protein
VKAAEGIVFILMDCTKRGSHADLMEKYGVRGYPTMVFLDPDGKVVGKLAGRGAADVTAQFRSLVEKHSRRTVWLESFDAAVKEAKKDPKPILIFFAGADKKSKVVAKGLQDEKAREVLSAFLLVRHEVEGDKEKACALCTKFGVKSAPEILVVDPTAEKPEAEPLARIAKWKSAKVFARKMEYVLKDWKKRLKKSREGKK